MRYIVTADVAYHHEVSPREAWGKATCAERSWGKDIIAAIIGGRLTSVYGENLTFIEGEEALTTWQEKWEHTHDTTHRQFYGEKENNVTCSYCFGPLTEPPLPDDYPLISGELPATPLIAARWRAQEKRDRGEL